MTEHVGTEYRPTSVSPPGATLADLLEERCIKQSELAERMGRPTKTINEIVKGKTAITSETAMQLERVLGTPAEFWLAREARYQEWLARQRDAKRLDECTDWLSELPVRDMVRFGWAPRSTRSAEMVSTCLDFFGVASVEAWHKRYRRPLATFRRSSKVQSSAGAIAAWLRQGEIEAARQVCRPFDREAFKRALSRLRTLTQEPSPEVFVPKLRDECAEFGVAVAFVPTPAGCPASGATRWLGAKALLQLSLRYKTNDHLWFTFFHEAGHILLHGKKLLFLESVGAIEQVHEDQANRFAADLLIPPESAKRLPTLRRTKDAVRQLAEEIGIAPGIVVGRMQNEGLLPWSHLNELKVRYDWREDRATN